MSKAKSLNITVLAAVLTGMALMLCACNAQKHNTAATRRYTAFITRYNIMYNGDKHFDETLQDMETKYEDDYSRMLYMHPAETRGLAKVPQPSGDFKRSIEKAQKAIQLRSIKRKPAKKTGKANNAEYREWMKREEYNPVLHDAWMLMGESQYYNGDFLGAASTFYYISKHFSWLPQTVTAAKLWQARSYLALDWLYEAEVIVTRIKPDELTDKSLKNLYNFTYGDLLYRQKQYEKAVPYIEAAINGASGPQKTRLRFLLGQVYQALGDNEKAYKAYGKAGGASSAPYRTKLNARIRQSEVYTGTDIEPEVKSLRRMTRYDRNSEYLDQIYYAIGNLYLTRGDTTDAISNYETAVAKSTRNGIDKAMAQVTLGGLYFDLHKYEKAQPCYSEAIPLLPETHPGYTLLKRRSDVLDELAVYSQNVTLQDSLLHLASLPEDQLLAAIDRIIDDLVKKEREAADEAMRQELMANQAANPGGLTANNQREFTMNSDDSWYFYNNASKSSGKTEFQRRWGSRKLEDDWRRRNKTTFNTSQFDAGAETAEDAETEANDSTVVDDAATAAENDPHKREYYLRQIPRTDEEKATAHEVIQDGLYNMGVILKDKLQDYPSARAEFGRLLKDYPDNIYRLDVYYNQYLMAVHENDAPAAERYRQLIITEFPDSKYGVALKDPNYIENLRMMDKRQQDLYEQTYQDYLANRNDRVHAAAVQIEEEYPLSKIIPKFMFLDALAYVTEKKPDDFNRVLREMLDRYPSTDLAPLASSWLKGMAQGRQLQTDAGGGNFRGMLWDISLSGDSTRTANDSIPAFTLDENAPQLLVLVFPSDQVEANELLYEVARHNFQSFVVRDFDLELMSFGRLGMLIIKGFENQRQLNHYRSVMANSNDFTLPPGVYPVAISQQNFDLMLEQGRSFDDYFRFLDRENYEDPQRNLLMPDQVETLEEAEEAAPPQPADEEEDAALPVIAPPTESTDTVPSTPVPTPVAEPTPSPTPVSAPAKASTPAKRSTPATPAKKDGAGTKPTEPKKDKKSSTVPTGSEGDDPLLK